MLRHTSPHNRLRGGEETAIFSGFFCWNPTLALKKGAEITLACASSPPSADRGRRIIFGRHLSLRLPVSHCEPGSATQTGLCLKCLQETLMWKSTSNAVKGLLWLVKEHLWQNFTQLEREREYLSSQAWVHLWGWHPNYWQVDRAMLLTSQNLLNVSGGKPVETIKSYFRSIRVWNNSIRYWKAAMVGDKHYSELHLWAFAHALFSNRGGKKKAASTASTEGWRDLSRFNQ